MKKMTGCFKFLKTKKGTPNSEQNPGQTTSNVNAENPTSSNAAANTSERALMPAVSDPGSSTAVWRFTYQELSNATDNFRSEFILGRGGSSTVYKGKLLDTNEIVAIKFLNPDTGEYKGTKYEFDVEVSMLSRADHPNLVRLIGSCKEEGRNERLVVYEYMPLGSLESHLHDLPPNKEGLDWNTRMAIAHGAAKGLNYLHNEMDPPMIYRDLKCANILLGEGYHAKLSDFGLAKKGPVGDVTQVRTQVMGTFGYCAPEYGTSGYLTFKSDIYSFGIVMLELITGKKASFLTEDGRQMYLPDWVGPILDQDMKKEYLQFADPKLNGQYPPTGLVRALTVAKMCILEDNARPNAAELVNALGFLSRQRYDPGAGSSSKSTLRRTRSF